MKRSDYYNADKRTEKYFEAVRGVRRELREAWENYEKKVEELKPFEGSPGYDQRLREATEQRNEEIENVKGFYAVEFQKIIDGMEGAIHKRKATAPKPDEVAIIQSLGQREALTPDEIEQAGRALTNPLALARLDEIAKKHGYKGKVFSEVGGAVILDNINSLAAAAGEICNCDHKPGTSGAELWGAYTNGDHAATHKAIKSLRYDRDINSEGEMLQSFGGVENVGEFSKIVNA